MKERIIIDGHIHCGPRTFTGYFMSGGSGKHDQISNPIESLEKNLKDIGVKGAVLLPFPEDIYRIAHVTPESPKLAHDYILRIAQDNEYMYPFYHVWTDFLIPENLDKFKGIKWHRHFWEDPEYNISGPQCDKFIGALRELDLPIIFEDSFENTKLFCNRYPDLKVIIPHIGLVNGGVLETINEFKSYPNTYVETSLAFPFQVIAAINYFGIDRVIFGSDTPYSSSKIELFKLLEYDLLKYLSEEDLDKILAKNMLQLMHV